MANLAAAVNATETLWTISADVDDDIDYFTIEDEVVKVTGNFPSQFDPQTRASVPPRIRVERAAGGTTAASHADSTALTPLIPPTVGGAGGEQTIRLLEPVDVAFNTAGLVNPAEGNGLEIAALSAGVRATVRYFPVTEWTGTSAGDVMQISVGRTNAEVVTIANYDVFESNTSTTAADADAAYIEGKLYRAAGAGTATELSNSLPRQVFVQDDIKVFAVFWPVATDPTAGTGRFLIEIAEPTA